MGAAAGLAQIDFLLDHVVEARAGGGQHDLDLELALAGTLLAHDALDLALRGDTHLLEELAQRHVELVFVHGDSPRLVIPERAQRVSGTQDHYFRALALGTGSRLSALTRSGRDDSTSTAARSVS